MVHDDEYYEIPIERLGLSVKAINALKHCGMLSVGDCVDWYICNYGRLPIGLSRPNVYEILRGEVTEKLIEHGYLPSPSDFEAEMLEELKQALIEKGYWSDNLPDSKVN